MEQSWEDQFRHLKKHHGMIDVSVAGKSQLRDPDALSRTLKIFEPISLSQMDDVKLMNRTDTKFVFKSELLPHILEELSGHYRVLEVANSRMSRYETLYYDTDDFKLYLDHQNGKLNRYKIRFRRYVDSGTGYFEIKFKNNKGRTIKERIRRDIADGGIEEGIKRLIKYNTHLDPEALSPKIWVNYTRITLVCISSRERLTLDINLDVKNEMTDKQFPDIVIAEVKQDASSRSPFLDMMKQRHIRKFSISKYCLAVMSLHEQVKKNNFKPKLLKLNKLISK